MNRSRIIRRINLTTLFVTIVVFCACEDDSSKHNTIDESSLDLTPSNTLWKTDIRFMDSVSTKATAHANKARVFNEKQETLLDSNVSVDFYDADGKPHARLTCDSAKIDNRTNNMWAYGHVVVDAPLSQTHVQTNLMMWDNTRRKLYSTEYVKISKANELIEGGVGFESDEAMTNYRIFKVSGVRQQ